MRAEQGKRMRSIHAARKSTHPPTCTAGSPPPPPPPHTHTCSPAPPHLVPEEELRLVQRRRQRGEAGVPLARHVSSCLLFRPGLCIRGRGRGPGECRVGVLRGRVKPWQRRVRHLARLLSMHSVCSHARDADPCAHTCVSMGVRVCVGGLGVGGAGSGQRRHTLTVASGGTGHEDGRQAFRFLLDELQHQRCPLAEPGRETLAACTCGARSHRRSLRVGVCTRWEGVVWGARGSKGGGSRCHACDATHHACCGRIARAHGEVQRADGMGWGVGGARGGGRHDCF